MNIFGHQIKLTPLCKQTKKKIGKKLFIQHQMNNLQTSCEKKRRKKNSFNTNKQPLGTTQKKKRGSSLTLKLFVKSGKMTPKPLVWSHKG
jgi:hypothetical protein